MYIGIDVGGMSIKAGIVSEDGKLLSKYAVKTPLENNDVFLGAMDEAIQGVLKQYGRECEIKAVGVGAPGLCDRKNGILIYSCNIPYDNAPVGEFLGEKYKVPVMVENDANCAAVGEYYASEGAENLVFITLGTGVGGGVIIGGKLFVGSNGAGTELGHIVTHAGGRKCGCGREGCWEAYASTTGLINLTKERIDTIKTFDKASHIGGRTAFEEAEKGDEGAIKIRDEWINEIAIGLTDIVNIFQPDEVLIGGAISKEGETIMKPVREYVLSHEYTNADKNITKTRILTSRLGEDAGIIGAALLWKNKNE